MVVSKREDDYFVDTTYKNNAEKYFLAQCQPLVLTTKPFQHVIHHVIVQTALNVQIAPTALGVKGVIPVKTVPDAKIQNVALNVQIVPHVKGVKIALTVLAAPTALTVSAAPIALTVSAAPIALIVKDS